MIKTAFNPWQWQFERNYAQAIEVKNAQSTLYCSGQVAIDQNGISSSADMKTQLLLCIENLQEVIKKADYSLEGIVRLNIYTTSTTELMQHFPILQEWLVKHKIKQATTVLEVKGLFENLTVELEATVVK
ncbi:RidA family protein [Myroides odoratimimus]|uniref:RidA family protein n=1 Tax=Myroides TaxID=76831 RepID=UPI00132B1138|nr:MULTISPECIES: RidA family protein [Myroides]MCS7475168.1 RidA family protein [Myroides odoratimimus]MDM1405723.1 RidA family protein [Myroides marinus]MEC4084922.1 RidA family protein [Myroides odoratimimus]MVX36593.1 RidA family protein [Myroides sp. LoEW2-1]